MRYILKNVARDWSSEGATERQQSYGRITRELQSWFAERPASEPAPRVLVPGAGLARLCCEIASLGYQAEGNEFSFAILLASAFVLNATEKRHQWTIHPYVLNGCNQVSEANQLRPVKVPDVSPAELVAEPGLLSMAAGDFLVNVP